MGLLAQALLPQGIFCFPRSDSDPKEHLLYLSSASPLFFNLSLTISHVSQSTIFTTIVLIVYPEYLNSLPQAFSRFPWLTRSALSFCMNLTCPSSFGSALNDVLEANVRVRGALAVVQSRHSTLGIPSLTDMNSLSLSSMSFDYCGFLFGEGIVVKTNLLKKALKLRASFEKSPISPSIYPSE